MVSKKVDINNIYLEEQLLMVASETRKSKHMYQMRKRGSVSLAFEKLLTLANTSIEYSLQISFLTRNIIN